MAETDSGTKDYRQAAGGVTLVYSTFPSLDAARTLARSLIERRLVACVNIIPGMTALYAWEGVLHEDTEVVAIFKTQSGHVAEVMTAVRAGHPYANPAVLALDAAASSRPYLDWVMSQTQRP